jgi:hypothetical protein
MTIDDLTNEQVEQNYYPSFFADLTLNKSHPNLNIPA